MGEFGREHPEYRLSYNGYEFIIIIIMVIIFMPRQTTRNDCLDTTIPILHERKEKKKMARKDQEEKMETSKRYEIALRSLSSIVSYTDT